MPYTPAPQPCWLILVEGDWLGCGADLTEGLVLAADLWAGELEAGSVGGPPPVLLRSDGLCVLLSCSVCGSWWVGDDGRAVHSAGVADALAGAAEDGWCGDVCPVCVAAELMP